MTWIKLDDGYPEHRKLKRAGDLRAFCIALDVTGMCFCGRFNTDGFICDADLPGVIDLLPAKWRRPVLDALVRIGRWERDDDRGGYWVHSYLEYNPSAAKRERIAKMGRERAQASRDRRSRERDANAQRTEREAPPHVRGDGGEGAATPSPSPLSTDVVPFLQVVGVDPEDRSKRTEGKGKGRPPRTPRHPSDDYVIGRARQIQAESGVEAARAYLSTVSRNYGQMSREEQLRRLEAIAAQDAAEAGDGQ